MDLDKVEEKDFEETEDSIKLSISGNHVEFKNFKKTKKFKELVKKGIKIVYKQSKVSDNGEHTEDVESEEITNNSFNKIITKLINNDRTDNSYLLGDYEYLFCDGEKDNEIIQIK